MWRFEDVLLLLVSGSGGFGSKGRSHGPPSHTCSNVTHCLCQSMYIVHKCTFCLFVFLECRIQHPIEMCGKSTCAHAGVLAPSDVTVTPFDRPKRSSPGPLPAFPDPSRTVLLYPHEVRSSYVHMQSAHNKN